MQTTELAEQIQTAQVLFVTSASRLLDEADAVRRQRDELLRLLGEAGKQPNPQKISTATDQQT